jgi:hypothetical protein
MSIARAHMQRTLAAKQSQAASSEPAAAIPGSMAEKMLALLAMHCAALKALKSRSAKIEAKRDMLPDYDAYLEGVVAADGGAQDPVVTTIMLWRLDVADWSRALDLAGYAIRHGLAMPESFARDVPCTLLEEIADYALALPAPAAELADKLQFALELTGECDMPDEVRAKAHKALGLIYEAADPERAVVHLETALSLDAKSGVKTVLSRLKKALDANKQTGA